MSSILPPATDAQPDLIAIRPYGNAGFKVHITYDQPAARAQMGTGNMVIRALPLCRRRLDGTRRSGARGSCHLIQGGPKNPTPWVDAMLKHTEPYICWPCVIKAGGLP